jgi:hypothetical protein
VDSYFSYLRSYSHELGSRILEMYPPVQGPDDPLAPEIVTLLRRPLPAQALTISGLAKTLLTKRSVRIVGECGTGKTLMSMGVVHTHAKGKPYTTISMCPPHLVYKWAREVFLTFPGRGSSLSTTCAMEETVRVRMASSKSRCEMAR